MPDTPAASKTVPLNPTRVMAQQNRVSVRTIERWVDAGILPPPERINGRKYWPDGTTPKFDRGNNDAA